MRVLLLLSLLAATPARAQWQAVPLPPGVTAGSFTFASAVAFGDAVFVVLPGFGVPAPGTTGFTYTNVLVSRDGGASWAAVPPFTGPAGSRGVGTPTVAGGTLYVPRTELDGAGDPSISVARTTDGTTWTVPAAAGYDARHGLLRNVARHRGLLYGVSQQARETTDENDGWLYASADEGATWTRGAAVRSGFLYDAGDRLVLGFGRLDRTPGQRSADGGATWSAHGAPVYSFARRGDLSLATAQFSLQRSADAGATYGPVASHVWGEKGNSVVVGACGRVFLHGTSQTVARSDDDGLTFTPWAEGLPADMASATVLGAFSCSADGPSAAGSPTYAYFSTSQGDGLYRRNLADLATAGEAPANVGGFTLAAAPNPSVGVAVLTANVPASGPARVTLHDALGRTVATLHDGPMAAGATRLVVPAGLAPGVYVARIATGGSASSVRFTITR